MGDTTSIDDLPTDPSSGNMNNNVVLQKMELSSGAGGVGRSSMLVVSPIFLIYSIKIDRLYLLRKTYFLFFRITAF